MYWKRLAGCAEVVGKNVFRCDGSFRSQDPGPPSLAIARLLTPHKHPMDHLYFDFLASCAFSTAFVKAL
jgi:hypothetical protein